MVMKRKIEFYLGADPTGVLNNTSPHPVALFGVQWPTAEHAFHAAKFPREPQLLQNLCQISAPQAKELAIENAAKVSVHWQVIRVDVMRVVLYEKFFQNQPARDILIGTGDAELIELIPDAYPWSNRPNTFWGRLSSGEGQNMLGTLLMEVRAYFADEAKLRP